MTHDTADPESIKRRLLENWDEEIQASAIYAKLAQRESDPQRKKVLEQLAEMEDRHAEKWAGRLGDLGVAVPERSKVRLPSSMALSLRFAPVDAIIAHQEAEERRLTGAHSDLTGDAATDALLEQIGREDAEHASALRGLMPGGGGGRQPKRNVQSALDRILSRETWHNQGGGGWIGGAIYGVNDGLAAVFGIVAGTSAATGGGHLVLIAGLAGAIASAVSMGSGAYLAARSEAELYEAQVAPERREVEEEPDEERKELELFYQLKGLSEAEANTLADRVCAEPRRAAGRDEIGGAAPGAGSRRQAGAGGLRGAGLNRCRRHHPGDPLLLHDRAGGHHLGRRHIDRRAFRGGRRQELFHAAQLVGVRA